VQPELKEGLMKTFSLSGSPSIAILFIICILLLGIALNYSKIDYWGEIKGIFTITKFSQKNLNSSRNKAYSKIIIWFLACLGFAFFAVLLFGSDDSYQIISFDKKNEVISTFFYKIAFSFGVFAIFIYLKKMLFFFIADTFSLNKHSITLFVNAFLSVFAFMGLVLLALSFLYVFLPLDSPNLILLFGTVFVGFAVLILSYFCLKIFFTGIVSLFYFFLYLCTLEILPFLVIVKLLIWTYEFS
jgi:hypothetical protein